MLCASHNMSEKLAYIFGFCVSMGSILIWIYGMAVCWIANQIFWLLVSLIFPPVGFVIGAYNLIF